MLREYYTVPKGYNQLGSAHYHADTASGYPAPHEHGFSAVDWKAARSGQWVFMGNDTFKGATFRLNTQTDGSKPTITAIDEKTLKERPWKEQQFEMRTGSLILQKVGN